jgi:hypothetical protein
MSSVVVEGPVQNSRTQAAVTVAAVPTNQKSAAHIPPGIPVRPASWSASELPLRPCRRVRRRERCSSRTARTPPNSRNQQSAAANPARTSGGAQTAASPRTPPVTSTASAPNALRIWIRVATSSASATHSRARVLPVATSAAPPSPSSGGAT